MGLSLGTFESTSIDTQKEVNRRLEKMHQEMCWPISASHMARPPKGCQKESSLDSCLHLRFI